MLQIFTPNPWFVFYMTLEREEFLNLEKSSLPNFTFTGSAFDVDLISLWQTQSYKDFLLNFPLDISVLVIHLGL